MADSLVLTDVKDVKKHTGTEMMLTRPKRGGDTHQLKEWWRNGISKCYVSCTVFDVTTAAGTVKLAIDSNKGTNIRIDHDGSFNFAFYGINEVRRAALFTESYELIEHYVFPSISGGKIMTVTPANGGSRPGGSDPDPNPEPTPAPTPAPTPEPTPAPTFAEKVAAADYSYAVTQANGKYFIDGVQQDTINAAPGETIHFDLSDASLSGHPFAIYTDSSKTTTVTVGVETDETGNSLLFTPPIAGTFSYQCTLHANMGGEIVIATTGGSGY